MRMNELLKKRRKDIEKIGYFIHLPLFSFSKNNGQWTISLVRRGGQKNRGCVVMHDAPSFFR